ncbi:N-acetyltransferase [Photobacterium sanctipauli]|uniref:N-acetyltransferase n=1 Tax=Photobacterium sanctipauli TaxID=1342794 RepID=A0A2T3NZK8_9GAMM|nr:GNAT family protein [Photobacterium sanctipauli]PSW21695.1 N-acetyltransferase [Photobacterium sanctipauli]
MVLEQFKEKDFAQLIKWIDSPELNYQWGGPAYDFPLTTEQIATHCANPDITPYLFKVNGDNVGFVELLKVSNTQYRLCRVFIDEAFRGRGLANNMLEEVMLKAKSQFDCAEISLAVFEHNKAAKKCYEELGFETYDQEVGRVVPNGDSWDLALMEKRI